MKSVSIKVGQLVAVVPDLLKFSYETIITGTPLQQSNLSIEIVPVSAYCKKCNQNFFIDEVEFYCPQCHSPELSLESGDELLISHLEVE